MSEVRRLLLFVGAQPGWMRLRDTEIVQRGTVLEDIPLQDAEEEPETVILVVPGTETAIHWIELPEHLAPAQAEGAARLMAADVSAEPLDSLHVAVGPQFEGEFERCMVLVADAKMFEWLTEAQALGFDPKHVVPESLLVVPPAEGLRTFRRAGVENVRGMRRAFAVEPELAELLVGDEKPERIDGDAWEAALPAALDPLVADLRQGKFARRRRWKVDWPLVRRLALMGAFILLVTLLIQLTLIMRYSFDADALERQAAERARDVLPGVVEVTHPEAQLRQRLQEVGGGPGYSAISAAVFAAVRQTAGAELQSIVYTSDGGMQITVAAPGAAELTAFEQRLGQEGAIVSPGVIRDAGGRQIGEYTVTAP